MESDENTQQTRSVPDKPIYVAGSANNDPQPCNSKLNPHTPSNGFTNGIHSGSVINSSVENPQSLRTALSCEENDNESDTDDGERNNMETGGCPKYRSCRERISSDMFDLEGPSGSKSMLRNSDGGSPCENRLSRKRAADCKVEKSNIDDEVSSSDTSNDYSLGSEDGCIYTYRGGEHLADLPSSFFSLDMGLPRDRLPGPMGFQAARPAQDVPIEERRNSRASSPDMDYLEMDFDPGPSCDADSGEESSPEIDLEASPSPEVPERSIPVQENTPEVSNNEQPLQPSPEHLTVEWGTAEACQPSTSKAGTSSASSVGGKEVPCESVAGTSCMRAGSLVSHVNARGERVLVRRTCRRWPPRAPVTHHTSSGDLVCERGSGEGTSVTNLTEAATSVDRINLSSALYHCTMAKKLIVEKPNADFLEEADTSNLSEGEMEPGDVEADCCDAPISEVSRCMIWSEREACERQVTQIATSACGATALVNAFLALGIPIDRDKILKAVGTRQRANSAPVPRYLLSRAVAGCTAGGLVSGLQQASSGLVTARFFPTYPERVVSLSHWLADWISLGAVPIATLNLQAGREPDDANLPDAWHHQMIFGVSPRGVFLTNPVECVPESQLWPQLCSDSVLLVRSRDVLSRLTPETDLTPLMAVPDPRWTSNNVLGQVVNLMRESRDANFPNLESRARSRHVRVPCAYRAGITLATLTGSEAHRRLTRAPHLPLLMSNPA